MKTTRIRVCLPSLPPVTIMAAALLIGLTVAVGVTYLALDQPWLGLQLSGDETGKAVIVRRAEGPALAIPAGTILTEIAGGGDSLVLEPLDVVAEPDGAMGTYATYRRFLERQERLSRIQASPEIVFTGSDGVRHTVRPVREGRPLGSLPVEFWVQVFVGCAGWLVAASVFAFRSREMSARYLLLSGAATLTFAPLAAVYSTRELAVPGLLFQWLNDLNFLGGSLFAGSFVALLLHYPRRIAPAWIGAGIVLLYIGWFLAQQAGVFESMTFARRFLVLVGVISTFALAAVHWARTGKDPVSRAVLQWFLISWMAGTLLFALFILLPQLFGVDTSPLQGYAFLLFLLVYGGLGFGIFRFRLFELGDWWRRIVVWTVTVLLLVLLDLFFVMQLHLSSELSLSLALLICGLFWLPLRALIWRRFVDRHRVRPEDLFGKVMDVALAPPGNADQAERWAGLLQEVFDPLNIEPGHEHLDNVLVTGDGLVMKVPGIVTIPPLRLEFAGSGRRLFSSRDVALAQELTTMLRYATESRAAYEEGVAAERQRIARDMHDNIGAQLLAALHRRDTDGKDATIRETLAEFRDIINNASRSGANLEETLAEIRHETADRLAGAGISFSWINSAGEAPCLDARKWSALRSIVREAVSNIIKHSGARAVSFKLSRRGEIFLMEIADDGTGFDPTKPSSGNGLANMRGRLAELGGNLRIEQRERGTGLIAELPFQEQLEEVP